MAIDKAKVNTEARALAFKWLRNVNQLKVQVSAPDSRPDLISAAFEREQRSFAALHNFRESLMIPGGKF